MKIRVELKTGGLRIFTLPIGLTVSEIVGFLDDKLGNSWVDYELI